MAVLASGNHEADVVAAGPDRLPGLEGGGKVFAGRGVADEEEVARRQAVFVADGRLFGVRDGPPVAFAQGEGADDGLAGRRREEAAELFQDVVRGDLDHVRAPQRRGNAPAVVQAVQPGAELRMREDVEVVEDEGDGTGKARGGDVGGREEADGGVARFFAPAGGGADRR